jgi:hypothetical protein
MQAKAPQPSESVWGVLELLVGKSLSFSTLLEAVLMGVQVEERRDGFEVLVGRAMRNGNLRWVWPGPSAIE